MEAVISKKHYHNNPYSAKEKLKALNLLESSTIEFVAHRYHCTIQTIYRWKRIYNGTIESLENGSCRPKSKHPNAHTDEEIKHIKDFIRRNPAIGLNELYGKLRVKYGYHRVGIIPKTLKTCINTGFLRTKKSSWQRFGNI